MVALTADQDPDDWGLDVAFHALVEKGDVQPELASMLRLELSNLQFGNDVAELDDVEEQQVKREVMPGGVEMCLPVDERESAAQLGESIHDPIHQRLLELTFSRIVGQREEVND